MAPAANAPTLNSVTMPYPAEYTEEQFYKGAVRRMANGSLVRDLVTNTRKLRFTLTWNMLTATDRNTVTTALSNVETGSSQTYLSPRNLSYTVVLAEDGEPEWTVTPVKNGIFGLTDKTSEKHGSTP